MRRFLCALSSMALHACGAATPQRAAPAETGVNQQPAWERSCREYAAAPVTLTYEDAPGGAAVVYRTEGNRDALRARTHEVARFHNSADPKAGVLHDLFHIEHRAYVEELDDGARLVLVPNNVAPNALVALRNHVQQDVFLMVQGGCAASNEAL